MADLPRDDPRPTPAFQRGALDVAIQSPAHSQAAGLYDRDVVETLKEICEWEGVSLPESWASMTEAEGRAFFDKLRAAMEENSARQAQRVRELEAMQNEALVEEIRLDERSRDDL